MSTEFKISTHAWKTEPENALCRCCHTEGSFKSLSTTYYWLDAEKVVYAKTIKECFNIELVGEIESLQHVLCAICYTCIQRLEDAVRFRRQIQKCETRFQQVYLGCVNKDPTFEVAIKEETLGPEENVAACQNGRGSSASPADRSGVNYDDDDGISDRDDGHYKLDPEEATPLKVSKTGKRKKAKISSAKVKKKNKVEKRMPIPIMAKNPEYMKNEEVLDTIEGVIKVVKRLIVKRDVDYKKTENTFQCLKCPFIGKTSHGIRDHIRTVHLNIPKHTCPSCNKSFPTLASFTKHKLEEHEIDHRFKCNACDHAFNTKIQLKRHINTFHMLGVKIKCQECDYETFSVESLYKHKFKHKTVKDYQCKYCRKAFVRKTTMQLHERIHTGDRRKVCAVCGQAFVQKASLNYHMTKYHPEVAF